MTITSVLSHVAALHRMHRHLLSAERHNYGMPIADSETSEKAILTLRCVESALIGSLGSVRP